MVNNSIHPYACKSSLTLLVLDLGLDVLDRVRRLDLEGDRLAGKSLDEDLHGCCALYVWVCGGNIRTRE